MSLLKNLKKYFAETSEEQVKKDWEATAKYDNVGSTVEDYMKDLNYDLGWLAGDYVIATQLPTLSTDDLKTNVVIEIPEELAKIWNEKDELWLKETDKQTKSKLFKENLKWYKKNIKDVYLEEEILVRITRVEPTNLELFGRGFEDALWDSDLSHYSFFEMVPNKEYGDTFIKLKRNV